MKFIEQIKKNKHSIIFFILVFTMFNLYFFFYLTDSKIVWYKEMVHQLEILLFELLNIGR